MSKPIQLEDRCPCCDYNLAGLPDNYRCPECGYEYEERATQIIEQSRFTRRVSRILGAYACSCFVMAGVLGRQSIYHRAFLGLMVVFGLVWFLGSWCKPRARNRIALWSNGFALIEEKRASHRFYWSGIGGVQYNYFGGGVIVRAPTAPSCIPSPPSSLAPSARCANSSRPPRSGVSSTTQRTSVRLPD